MSTAATHPAHGNTTAAILCVAFALREKPWQLGCTTGHGHKPRERSMPARDHARVLDAIAQATRRWGLPATAPVVRGDAAGREGFGLHRFVLAQGMTNPGVDSASLAGNRRRRRAQSDGVDVRTLLSMLMRYDPGARQGWQVVQGPAVEAEDPRHLHRAVETLTRERASPTTRLKG